MKYIYREIIIMMIAYIGSVLCILVINKKNSKNISSIKYILSVILVPVSVLVEQVIINTLDIVCAPLISSEAMNLGMVNAIYKIALIFISFITIIIIFKLIAECKITKGIWLALAICIVICIVACIMLGIYEAEMSEMLSDKLRKINEADLFLWLYLYDVDVDMTKLNIISDVLIINRCILVILLTWNVVNQLLKKDFLKSEAETETESSN